MKRFNDKTRQRSAEHVEDVRLRAAAERLGAKLTKDALVMHILQRDKTIARQARELHALREEKARLARELTQFQEINCAVHALARHETRKGRRDDVPKGEPQNITHPRALTEVLAKLMDVAGDVTRIEEEFLAELPEIIEDRRKLLDLAGLDEHAFRAISWRL